VKGVTTFKATKALRKSIRKIVGRLRRDKGSVSHATRKASVSPATGKASVSHATSKANASSAATSKKPSKRRSRASPTDVTGETVFDDRPLRFRNLTLAEPNLPSFEDASNTLGAFKIRLAKRTGARRDAGALIERRYGGRGYAIPGPEVKSNVLTFIAYDEGQIVGTVGLGLDSDKGRLSADELYRSEIDQLRAKGWRVCEFTRLAVDSTAASKPVLAGLFQTAYLYAAVIKGYTHAVIEVNPRHVVFYGKSLNFEQVGPERMNERVHAPAVLLCASFALIAHDLEKYAGKTPAPGTKRTLFHYGFPPAGEAGALERLRERELVA
jgi:hypothetical protein